MYNVLMGRKYKSSTKMRIRTMLSGPEKRNVQQPIRNKVIYGMLLRILVKIFVMS